MVDFDETKHFHPAMIDMESHMNNFAIALAVPFVITMTIGTAKGTVRPLEIAQYLIYGDQSGSLRVRSGIETSFYTFTGYYFGAIVSTVVGLMSYNLLKMFGLDVVIEETVEQFLEWFSDTKAIVGSKGDEEGNDDEDDTDENATPDSDVE